MRGDGSIFQVMMKAAATINRETKFLLQLARKLLLVRKSSSIWR